MYIYHSLNRIASTWMPTLRALVFGSDRPSVPVSSYVSYVIGHHHPKYALTWLNVDSNMCI